MNMICIIATDAVPRIFGNESPHLLITFYEIRLDHLRQEQYKRKWTKVPYLF